MNLDNKIAVIGFSGVFPGARSEDELWQLLSYGERHFTEIPIERWDVDSFYSEDRYARNKTLSKWVAPIDIDESQGSKFRPSCRESAFIDPQQTLLLEQTQNCLDNAKLTAGWLSDHQVSVTIGCMNIDQQLKVQQEMDEVGVLPASTTGSYEALLANRVSQVFGFTGESKSVNAACSSSGIALADAIRKLRSGETEYCLVGAANLNLLPLKYLSFSKAGMLSPSGECKPFDIEANGYVPGDAVAVVLLSRLSTAQANDHKVHAVIEGFASNHNGNKAIASTAPNVYAQYDLLKDALNDAEVEASSVSYIEAHGTGTSLGDPIEVEALSQVYGDTGAYVGSIKGNIGHTEATAGLAGLIKVILMMKNGKVPPNSWLDRLNPLIKERQSSLIFPTELADWHSKGKYYASISSFGFGGANTNIIVSAPDLADENNEVESVYLFAGSTAEQLQQTVSALSLGKLDQIKRFGQLQNGTETCLQQYRKFIRIGKGQAVPTSLLSSSTHLQPNQYPLISLTGLGDCSLLTKVLPYLKGGVLLADQNINIGNIETSNLLNTLPSHSVLFGSDVCAVNLPIKIDKLSSTFDSLLSQNNSELKDKASLLMEHQFTFKLLVQRWQQLVNKCLTTMEPSAPNQGNIVSNLPIVMAYASLYLKWSMSERTLGTEAMVMQVLIEQKVITEKQIIECVLSEHITVQALIESAITELLRNKPESFAACSQRIGAACALSSEINLDKLNANTGNHINILPQAINLTDSLTPVSIEHQQLESCIAEYWEHGGQIDWHQYAKSGSSNQSSNTELIIVSCDRYVSKAKQVTNQGSDDVKRLEVVD